MLTMHEFINANAFFVDGARVEVAHIFRGSVMLKGGRVVSADSVYVGSVLLSEALRRGREWAEADRISQTVRKESVLSAPLVESGRDRRKRMMMSWEDENRKRRQSAKDDKTKNPGSPESDEELRHTIRSEFTPEAEICRRVYRLHRAGMSDQSISKNLGLAQRKVARLIRRGDTWYAKTW